jgi:cysteine-rich repeat protein
LQENAFKINRLWMRLAALRKALRASIDLCSHSVMRVSRALRFLAPLSLACLVQACASGSESDTGVEPPFEGGAGTAGKAGAAGKGGTAGTSGKGGASGKGGSSAGTGGDSGAGGTAGKGGSAGQGGSSGKGGSSGTGGGSGKGGSSSGSGGDSGAGGDSGSAGTGGDSGAAGDAGTGGSSAGAGGGKPNGGAGGSTGGSGGGTAGKGGTGSQDPVCGNGIKDGTEPCDGSDFGTATCASVIGDDTLGGSLKCESCKIRTDGCTKNPTCGDGKINGAGEQCDGSDVGTATCAFATGNPNMSGELGCTAGCKYDTSACKTGIYCGDGTKNGSEECDKLDLGDADCKSATNDAKPVGTLSCDASCKLDTSLCATNVTCGDGVRNQISEKCDGSDLGGADCRTFLGDPAATGTLKCATDCSFDGAACALAASCGDGKIDAGEACDTAAFGSATCESEKGIGWTGSLTCTADCKISSASCTPIAACGDGTKNQPTEQCDGTDIAGATCVGSVGTGSTGSVKCNPNCTLDTTGCSAPTLCGNGTIDSGEACDGANLGGKTCKTVLGNSNAIGTLKCTSCSLDASACSIPPYCGDGKLDAGEECDDGNNSNGPSPRGDGCTSTCQVACRYGTKFGTHCYEEVTSERTWQAAQNDCLSVGGYLATVTSSAEQSYLITSVMRSDGVDRYWLGLTDAVTEGSYKWVSGEPFSYSNWKSGEPNNSGNEDCVEYRWSCSFFGGCSPDGWNDQSCGTSLSYVCEYPPPVKFP